MKFKPYLKYKASGVEWLGDVPDEWDVAALKRNYSIIGGSTPKSDNEAFWDGDISWVTPTDLSKMDTFEIKNSIRTITAEGFASCGTTLVPSGSLILSTRAPIGSLGIATKELCTNQGCKALVPRDDTNSRFCAYLLSIATEALNICGRGTTFLELSGDALGAFKATFPLLPVQNVVSDFLDRETAKLDTLIAKQERLIELLQEKRQAMISHAVTKGLDPSVPMRDSGIEWLGMVPEHWKVLHLSRVAIGGTQNGLYKPPSGHDPSGIPCISMGEAFSGRIISLKARDRVILSEEEFEKYRLDEGDLLFARRSLVFEGSGKCSLISAQAAGQVFESSIIRIKLNRDLLLPEFALLFMASIPGRYQILSITDQTTISGINSQNLRQCVIPVPSLDDQAQIVDDIVRYDKTFDALVSKSRRNTDLMREHRTALISAAVTGKIDVRGEPSNATH